MSQRSHPIRSVSYGALTDFRGVTMLPSLKAQPGRLTLAPGGLRASVHHLVTQSIQRGYSLRGQQVPLLFSLKANLIRSRHDPTSLN